MSVSCQPIIDKPCIDSESILNGGGQIVEQIDGTVSVWVKETSGLVPYTNINTKPCCELLGYTFDIDNQKCLWDDSISCDTCEMKIVINPNGDDGDYFYFNDSDNCNLDISLDYLFKFDCSVLKSGETVNQQALDILKEIDDLNNLLDETKIQCTILSGQCEYYTNIYENMCYPIVINNHILNPEGPTPDGQTSSNERRALLTPSAYQTICCLTEEGLIRWQSLLGEIKYNGWLINNGCNTDYYTNEQANLIFTEGNELAINNNGYNPYLQQTNDDLCSKNEAYIKMKTICSEYEDCLTEIDNIQNNIADLEAELNSIPTALCDDPIANLENFKAWFSLDVETDVPMLYETVYEESIFDIGEGNLMNYIITRGNTTGILISGDTGILPEFSHETSCDYNEMCKVYRDNFMRELYLTQYTQAYGIPQNTTENAELLDLMGNWYNSDWLNYGITLNDPEIIKKLQNRKIRISIKVNTCCLDFGILLDKIKVTQSCEVLDETNISISKPIGFELEKVIDNKKSWVNSETIDRRLFELGWRGTDYKISDYNLGVNTKEIDLSIDPAKAIEGDVYNYIYNNPCALDCSSGATYVNINVDVDFDTYYQQAIDICSGCSQQYQFQDDDCYNFMDNTPYQFQFQQVSITGSTIISGVWGITAMIDNNIIYSNPNFYSGYTAPMKYQYLNVLNQLATSIGARFEYTSGSTAQILSDYGCYIGNGFSGDSLKIDISLDIIIDY